MYKIRFVGPACQTLASVDCTARNDLQAIAIARSEGMAMGYSNFVIYKNHKFVFDSRGF